MSTAQEVGPMMWGETVPAQCIHHGVKTFPIGGVHLCLGCLRAFNKEMEDDYIPMLVGAFLIEQRKSA